MENINMNILFVCAGNCSRSPMAEIYFRHLLKQNKLDQDVTCQSVGLSVEEESTLPEEAQEVMVSLGLTLENHIPTAINEDIIEGSTNIVVMSQKQADTLKKAHPELKEEGRVRTLLSFLDSNDEVDDPHRGDLETFQQCFLTMMPALASLTDRIIRSLR